MDTDTLAREELTTINQELQKKIAEQEAEIEQYRNPPPNDWHSWLDVELHIMLQKYYPDVDIIREFVLGVQPQRADFIVLRKRHVDLILKIYDIFRRHNILEFKSPSDEQSMSDLWKTVSYAASYIRNCPEINCADYAGQTFICKEENEGVAGYGEAF